MSPEYTKKNFPDNWLSVVIPALNEEKTIEKTLLALQSTLDPMLSEIIVVDNGSTDQTISKASGLGVKVLSVPFVNVSELRNCGVLASNGKIIAFIDADVVVADNWGGILESSFRGMHEDELFISGSRCKSARTEGFLYKHWYSLLGSTKILYINSGHLITNKNTFSLLGGFNRNLTTGEDYDFCRRAEALAVRIIPKASLIAYHTGYPSKIRNFFSREVWHGLEDSTNFRSFSNSKTALVASLMPCSCLLGLTIALLQHTLFPIFASLAFILILVTTFTLIKFDGKEINNLILTSTISFIYLSARSVSLLFGILRLSYRKSDVEREG